ncbi:hypothetical protein, partial [Escherichia coli]|uniref:hypothetical protein n=1 Tax=Escherichia coli TaxID=562 RepID=UPI000CB8663D
DEDRAELHNVDLALEGLVADTPRAAAICRWIGQCQTAEDQRDTATSELARLRAEGEAKDRRIAVLEAALAPFADALAIVERDEAAAFYA